MHYSAAGEMVRGVHTASVAKAAAKDATKTEQASSGETEARQCPL